MLWRLDCLFMVKILSIVCKRTVIITIHISFSFRCFIKMNQIKEKRARQRESTMKITWEMKWKMPSRKFAMQLAVQLVFLSSSSNGLYISIALFTGCFVVPPPPACQHLIGQNRSMIFVIWWGCVIQLERCLFISLLFARRWKLTFSKWKRSWNLVSWVLTVTSFYQIVK